MTTKLLLILILASALSCKAGNVHWDYSPKGDSGPSHWAEVYGQCAGSRQSPIDLLTKAEAVTYAPLQLQHYSLPPGKAHLTNNGHTAKLSTEPVSQDTAPTMLGGGLPAQYTFSQVHFHWGSKEEQGSEHTVDGKAYPVEMHLVHYKASFPNISAAVDPAQSSPDNLAVLGVFFTVTGSPNPGLAQLLPRMPEVKKTKAKILDAPLFPLSSLLDTADLSSFFRYKGSLTTPGCNEIVQWTVLRNPISITRDQLEALRALEDGHSKPLVDNFRPVQPLGERKLYSVTASGTRLVSGLVLIVILGIQGML